MKQTTQSNYSLKSACLRVARRGILQLTIQVIPADIPRALCDEIIAGSYTLKDPELDEPFVVNQELDETMDLYGSMLGQWCYPMRSDECLEGGYTRLTRLEDFDLDRAYRRRPAKLKVVFPGPFLYQHLPAMGICLSSLRILHLVFPGPVLAMHMDVLAQLAEPTWSTLEELRLDYHDAKLDGFPTNFGVFPYLKKLSIVIWSYSRDEADKFEDNGSDKFLKHLPDLHLLQLEELCFFCYNSGVTKWEEHQLDRIVRSAPRLKSLRTNLDVCQGRPRTAIMRKIYRDAFDGDKLRPFSKFETRSGPEVYIGTAKMHNLTSMGHRLSIKVMREILNRPHYNLSEARCSMEEIGEMGRLAPNVQRLWLSEVLLPLHDLEGLESNLFSVFTDERDDAWFPHLRSILIDKLKASYKGKKKKSSARTILARPTDGINAFVAAAFRRHPALERVMIKRMDDATHPCRKDFFPRLGMDISRNDWEIHRVCFPVVFFVGQVQEKKEKKPKKARKGK